MFDLAIGVGRSIVFMCLLTCVVNVVVHVVLYATKFWISMDIVCITCSSKLMHYYSLINLIIKGRISYTENIYFKSLIPGHDMGFDNEKTKLR